MIGENQPKEITAMKLIFAGLLAGIVLITSAQGADAYHNGGRPTVWRGPTPEYCLEVYDPVHDSRGNTYPNSCYAAREGVRVTWPGPGTDQ